MIELNITPKEFDQAVFQTNTELNQEQYNTWLHDTATKAMQRIYEKIDGQVIPHDQYLLGDVINLLSTIRITTEPQASPWVVTPDDIATRYDISHLSDEEVRTLVDSCSRAMSNDGMADYYWEGIRYVCEEVYCLNEKDDEEDEECSGDDYHRNANALYVHLRSQHKDDDYDYAREFLGTEIKGDEYQTIPLSLTERRIVDAMTNHEHSMELYEIHWNDEDYSDYESAMEALCQLVEADIDCRYKWDKHGMPYLLSKK